MLSVVIPVLNESASLQDLVAQLQETAGQHDYVMELILVDDGSTDDTWSVITQLAAQHANVRGLRLRRNFGKSNALSAGFDEARGDLIITLDGDLQDDPAEIPKLLVPIDQGYDVVSGWKQVRHDPWHKVVLSRGFNWLVRRLTGVPLHDHNCGFKCYRREIFQEIRLYGELHRFVPVLAAARGFRVGEVVVRHRPRQHGVSKYGLGRIPKGLLDLLTVKFLTGYGQRPQHLLGTLGLLGFAAEGIGIFLLSTWWLLSRWSVIHSMFPEVSPIHLHERPIFYLSLTALVLGCQLVSIGFLAELIIAFQSRQRANYSIAQRTERSHADQIPPSAPQSAPPSPHPTPEGDPHLRVSH